MPMGDKEPYVPRRRLIRCVRCGYEYDSIAMRKCNHAAVNLTYGKYGEPVMVCWRCCAKKPCPNYIKDKFVGNGCKLDEKN